MGKGLRHAVYFTQYLGDAQIVYYATLAGNDTRVAIHCDGSEPALAVGKMVGLSADADRIHFFDTSGRALPAKHHCPITHEVPA